MSTSRAALGHSDILHNDLCRSAVTLPLANPSFWAAAICVAAACFEGIMSGTGVKNRFAELRLPKYTPALWVWSFIGGAYYVLFFFLLKSILDRPPVRLWTWFTLTLMALMLIANASWNWIFFRKKNLWLSFTFFVPYILLSLVLAGFLHRIRNPLSGWYSALYPAYLLYATWWGYRVWRLNSSSPQNT